MKIFQKEKVELKQLKGNHAIRRSRFFVVDRKTYSSYPHLEAYNYGLVSIYLGRGLRQELPMETSAHTYSCRIHQTALGVTTDISTIGAVHYCENSFIGIDNISNIYSKYLNIIEQGSSEEALVYLYTSLIDLLPHIDRCKRFIDGLPISLLSVDSIVHILNALSPIKDKLSNWNSFVANSKKVLVQLEGEDNANDLLGVIL